MAFQRLDRASLTDWDDAQVLRQLVPEFTFVAVNEPSDAVDWDEDALPCYEVVYVADGELNMWVEGEPQPAGSGDVFVIPPKVRHREETPADKHSSLICLGAGFRYPSGRRRRFPMPIALKLHLPPGHVVEQRLRRIVTEVYRRAPGYSAIVLASVLDIFCELGRLSEEIEVREVDIGEIRRTRLISQARDFILDHYADPMSVDDMAQHFFLSREYFIRLFRRVTGQTPHAYLTQVRIEKAQDLLRSPDLSVKAVAAQVGFNDQHYFTKVFSKHTGMPPTQYQRRSVALH